LCHRHAGPPGQPVPNAMKSRPAAVSTIRATSLEPCAANSSSPNMQPRSPHDLATEPGVLKRRGVLPFALKSPYALPLQPSPLPRRETVRSRVPYAAASNPRKDVDPVLGGVSVGFVWPVGRCPWQYLSESVAGIAGIPHRTSASTVRRGQGCPLPSCWYEPYPITCNHFLVV
jgi:hypothetical protein